MEVETILVSVGKGVWWRSDSMAGMVMNIDLKITMSICEHVNMYKNENKELYIQNKLRSCFEPAICVLLVFDGLVGG